MSLGPMEDAPKPPKHLIDLDGSETIFIDGKYVPITMSKDYVDIGCSIVSIIVIKHILKKHDEHFRGDAKINLQ